MVLNDLLTRQNVFTKLVLKDGDKELPKELKVKVMRMRMAYAKVRKNFDAEVQEFTEELLSDEFKELNGKQDRTPEEEARFQELSTSINNDYQEFLFQKGREEVKDIEEYFTLSEYADILDVNSGGEVEINGNKIPAVDFMEVVYDLFVKED